MRFAVVRGSTSLRSILKDLEEWDLLILLGPLSRTLLLEQNLISRIFDIYKDRVIIIPSSYDDPSVYRIIVKAYNGIICRRELKSSRMIIRCTSSLSDLERIIRDSCREVRELVFIERSLRIDDNLGASSCEDIMKRILIYHGTSGSPGIVVDRFLKIWISHGESVRILIDYDRRSLRIEFLEREDSHSRSMRLIAQVPSILKD
ncbi:MAG: hypothetical protein QXJ51_03700 [Sulfolobales archaeon]